VANRLLILDGLSELNLGQDIFKACKNLNIDVNYFDLSKQKLRRTYFLFKKLIKLKDLFAGKRKYTNQASYKFETSELAGLLESTKPTHILVIRYAFKFIDPIVLKTLSTKINAKLFLYDSDSFNLTPNINEFKYFVKNEIVIYDEVFSFSKVATDLLNRVSSVQSTFLPYGCTPSKIPQNQIKDIDVLFVGRASIRRILILEAISDSVVVYGDRYDKYDEFISAKLKTKIVHQTIWNDDLFNLMQRSKIVINITNTNFYAYETGLNLRIFEALSAGCFILTEHNEEIASLFDIGKEVETYISSSELKDKVDFYLENTESRNLIAKMVI